MAHWNDLESHINAIFITNAVCAIKPFFYVWSATGSWVTLPIKMSAQEPASDHATTQQWNNVISISIQHLMLYCCHYNIVSVGKNVFKIAIWVVTSWFYSHKFCLKVISPRNNKNAICSRKNEDLPPQMTTFKYSSPHSNAHFHLFCFENEEIYFLKWWFSIQLSPIYCTFLFILF